MSLTAIQRHTLRMIAERPRNWETVHASTIAKLRKLGLIENEDHLDDRGGLVRYLRITKAGRRVVVADRE